MNDTLSLLGYQEKQSVRVGDRYIILAEDAASGEVYMVCDCVRDIAPDTARFSSPFISMDYLDILNEFSSRIRRAVETIRDKRLEWGVSLAPFTAEDCLPEKKFFRLEGQIIVRKPESLPPEYRTADHQLGLAMGECSISDEYERAISVTEISTGKPCRWDLCDVAGVLRPDRLPNWAKARLESLLHETLEELLPDIARILDKWENTTHEAG